MGNLNKELRPLFHAYLKRLAEERTRPTTVRSAANNYREGSLFNSSREFTGVIYFYEWSDVSRTPKTFYTMEKFEDFLESCNICIMGYQREIIKNMHNPYIACKKGTKELVIKMNYEALKKAVNLDTSPISFNNFMAKGSEDREPYQVVVARPPIQRPPMYEPEGRYPDEDEFQWYG